MNMLELNVNNQKLIKWLINILSLLTYRQYTIMK